MEHAKKIFEFIAKDTCKQNESKKLIMVLRIEILSVLFYLFINSIMCLSFQVQGGVFYFAFVPFFAALFMLSYYVTTHHTYILYNLMMMGIVFTVVKRFGWNIGVQHFIIVLLIMNFFAGYGYNKMKVCYAVLLGALRIVLFFVFRSRVSMYEINTIEEAAFQIVATISVFWCVSVIALVFSKTSQELEGKLVEYNHQLKAQADTDALTGLYNRRRIMEYMNDLANVKGEKENFCLCICDIDFFKRVNDKYGHDMGDEVLKEVAQIFKKHMNGVGLASRWGGEEFMLLFYNCNGDNAYIQLEEISSEIKRHMFYAGDQAFNITMTYGLVEYDYNNGSDVTIKEADEKLYLGKERGRDRIVY